MRALPFLILFFILSSCTNSTKEAPAEKEDLLENGTIQVDSTHLNFVIEGSGTPCLVIGSSVYYPKTFSKNLREHYRFYFVDLHWFAKGYTLVKSENFTLETIISDIEKARQALQLEKPLLIGHSIHGTIAMEYTKRYPQNVSGLVMIGSPSIWASDTYNKAASAYWETAPAERKAIDEKSREELQERLAQLPPDKVMAANYIASSARYWYDPEYDAGWLWEDMVVNNDLISHLFGTIFLGYDMFENMNKLDVPVLLVLGKHDYVIPPTIWQDSYDSLTDFTRILLEKSGHTPQLEDPAAFDKILLEWVAEKVDKLNSVQF